MANGFCSRVYRCDTSVTSPVTATRLPPISESKSFSAVIPLPAPRRAIKSNSALFDSDTPKSSRSHCPF